MRFIITALFISLASQFAIGQIKASGTVYYPGYRGMGRVTASGSKVDMGKLKKGELRWVALSRDLFKEFNMGDTIIVKCDNDAVEGEWVVKDRMGTRHSRCVDFMMHYTHKVNVSTIRKITLYHKGDNCANTKE